MRGLPLTLALALAPMATLACVTADDVAKGVRFVDDEGTVIEHRSSTDGVIQVSYDYGDGAGTLETRLFGLHPIVIQEVSGGEPLAGVRFEMSYEGGIIALPHPDVIDTFSIASTMSFGGDATDWVVTYTAEAPGTTDLDGCSYATRAIRLENQGPLDPVQWEEFTYFIDLGIAHLAASGVGNARFDTPALSLEVVER